jgi:hypothetical protein
MFMALLPAVRPALVMPGLVPGIHVFLPQQQKQDVDGRDEPGHDGAGPIAIYSSAIVTG